MKRILDRLGGIVPEGAQLELLSALDHSRNNGKRIAIEPGARKIYGEPAVDHHFRKSGQDDCIDCRYGELPKELSWGLVCCTTSILHAFYSGETEGILPDRNYHKDVEADWDQALASLILLGGYDALPLVLSQMNLLFFEEFAIFGKGQQVSRRLQEPIRHHEVRVYRKKAEVPIVFIKYPQSQLPVKDGRWHHYVANILDNQVTQDELEKGVVTLVAHGKSVKDEQAIREGRIVRGKTLSLILGIMAVNDFHWYAQPGECAGATKLHMSIAEQIADTHFFEPFGRNALVFARKTHQGDRTEGLEKVLKAIEDSGFN